MKTLGFLFWLFPSMLFASSGLTLSQAWTKAFESDIFPADLSHKSFNMHLLGVSSEGVLCELVARGFDRKFSLFYAGPNRPLNIREIHETADQILVQDFKSSQSSESQNTVYTFSFEQHAASARKIGLSLEISSSSFSRLLVDGSVFFVHTNYVTRTDTDIECKILRTVYTHRERASLLRGD